MIDILATPDQLDIGYKWITTLFPAKGDNAAYAAAFATFSSTLAFLGSLFVAWHVMIGIVSSAYSGKVLGEKYHQIWAPLRVVLGFGMMVPVAGGFSSVHYLLRDVVGPAAINLGNAPIVAYIDSLGANGGDISIAAMQGKFIANDILEREVCVAVQNAVYDHSFWPGTAKARYAPEGGVPHGSSMFWIYDSCGSIFFTLPTQDTGIPGGDERLQTFNAARNTATAELISTIRKSLTDPYKKQIGDYFATTEYAKLPDYDIANAMVQAGRIPNDLRSVVYNACVTWDTKIATAAKQVYSGATDENKKKLRERIVTYGFMAAGSYERELSKMSGGVTTLANTYPTKVDPNPGAGYVEPFRAAMKAITSVNGLDADKVMMEGSGVGDSNGNTLDYIISQILPNIGAMKIQAERQDPVGDMIAMGHSFLAAGAMGIVVMIGIQAGAGFAGGNLISSVTGVGGAAMAVVQYLSGWVGYLIVSMFIIGVVHAFVLPMLPMMMVFVMGVSWLVLFLEAAIASVLWAFAFIRMDGQDFFDKNQSPGATLVFNLFLRPALGMLAYIGSLLLLPALLNGLSILWDQSYLQQTGQFGILFVVQWMVGLIMFTWMQWHLTMRMFGLIPTIADRVGHWMGFGQGHGYDDGRGTVEATGALMAAGMAVAKSPLMPSGGGGGGTKTPKQPDPKANEGGEGGGGSDGGGSGGGGSGGGGSSGSGGGGLSQQTKASADRVPQQPQPKKDN